MSIKILKLPLCLLGLFLIIFCSSTYALPPLKGNTVKHHGVPSLALNMEDPAPTGEMDDDEEEGSGSNGNGGPTASPTAVCNVNAFATTNSTVLINEIKTQGASCVNELFSATSIQPTAFDSNNMYSVANHTASLAGSYTGNGDPDLEALYLYLRAGYYAEYYNPSVTFISWVHPAVEGAIDAFVNNASFYNNNDGHGQVLQEVIIAMDSINKQGKYLFVVKEWLGRWNQSYGTSWYMRSAVNGIFTILFRGQWNTNFVSLVGTDTTLVSRLRSFTMMTWMINNPDAEYMIANAGRELGRLKMYTGTAIQSSVDAGLNNIFNSYQMYGYGDAVWLAAADTGAYYGNCADYTICGYEAQVEAQALSQIYTCSSTIKIRSQELTAVQQSSACSTMGAEETYFHSKLQTGNQPIPGDYNTQLQVNIFNSDTDYQKYAAAIFKIDTNNGGMYLEGNPADPNNIPNFVAYEASYAKPDHYVWNLEHEYVHYLDGRFNLAGDFNAPTAKVVWWAEGVAEYISVKDDNQAAYDTIHDGSTYGLGTIFETTYDGFDQDRIYRWGYLAVRFMFEMHFSEISAMRNETRAGNWSAYQSRVNSWASSYSNEFTSWTQTVQPPGGGSSSSSSGGSSSGGSSSGGSSSGGNQLQNGVPVSGLSANTGSEVNYYITVPSGASNLVISISGGSGDADLYTQYGTAPTDSSYACRPYIGGNNESCTEPNPTAGTWYVRVKAYSSFSGLTLSASYSGGGSSSSSSGGSSSGGSSSGGSSSGGSSSGGSSSGGSSSSSGGSSSGGCGQITGNANGPYTGTVGVPLNFSSAGSCSPNGGIVEQEWDFGNGGSSTQANPSHTYNTTGTYEVVLLVIDDIGNEAEVITTATITSGGGSSSSGGSSSGGSSSGGSSSGGTSSGGSSSGGSSSGGSSSGGSSSSSGGSSSGGCSQITGNANGPYTGNVGTPVNFSSAGSCSPNGGIVEQEWDFGDGGSSTQANPSHTYNSAGTYEVVLLVIDDIGDEAEVITTVTITSGGGSSSSGGGSSGGGIANACATQAPQDYISLSNGSPVCVVGGNGGSIYFYFSVTSATTSITVRTEHGSGNADLYYRAADWPTSSVYDSISAGSGNAESVTILNSGSGTRFIMIAGSHSGLTIQVDLTGGGPGETSPPPSGIADACATESSKNKVQLTSGDAVCVKSSSDSWRSRRFYFSVPSSASTIRIRTAHGTGNGNLYYRKSSYPSTSSYHAKSTSGDNMEDITVNASGGTGYVKVYGAHSGMSVQVDFN